MTPIASIQVLTWTQPCEGGWRVHCNCGFTSERYRSKRLAEDKLARHHSKHRVTRVAA